MDQLKFSTLDMKSKSFVDMLKRELNNIGSDISDELGGWNDALSDELGSWGDAFKDAF